MNAFRSAFWAEALKARRSIVPALTTAGFLLIPLVDGLFMVILKDPERARAMGLISVKAQLVAGVADWPTLAPTSNTVLIRVRGRFASRSANRSIPRSVIFEAA